MNPHRNPPGNRETGVVMVTMVVLVIAVVAASGLVVDGGQHRRSRGAYRVTRT